MKNQNIQEMSNEALLKQKNTVKVATGSLAGLLAILLMAAIFLIFQQSFTIGLPFIAICVSLTPIILMNVANIRKIDQELATRTDVR